MDDSDSGLRLPERHAHFQEFLIEFGLQGLSEKLHSAEALILNRLQQLDQITNSREERMALRDASSILRVMKHEDLHPSALE
jgi:hypothetical protein